MADTPSPVGVVNLYHRSTDITTLQECPMKYALSRIYEPDATAGYFIFGTSGHLYASERLGGATPEAAWEAAAMSLADAWNAAVEAGQEVRWTKKRPEEAAFDNLRELCQKWEADYEPFYGDWEVLAVEHQTQAESRGTLISTQIDAMFRDNTSTHTIVDWKFGATAKANPVQLQVYGWAARHCPQSPLFGVPAENVRLVFHHVAFSKQQEVDFMPDPYIEGLLYWTTRQKQQMVETGFAPAVTEWWCRYCLYQSHCPAFDGDIREVGSLLQSAGLEERPQG